MKRCYVWNVVLYGIQTWPVKKKNMKYLECFEMWLQRKMLTISWRDRVTNMEVLSRVGEDSSIMKSIQRRKANWIGHIRDITIYRKQSKKEKWKGRETEEEWEC